MAAETMSETRERSRSPYKGAAEPEEPEAEAPRKRPRTEPPGGIYIYCKISHIYDLYSIDM